MADELNVRFSGADRYLQAALTGLSARQRAIANNVANVDTPNFKAGEVRFEDVLKNAVQGRDSRLSRSDEQLKAAVTRQSQVEGTTVRADGNNVDIDREMTQLAETTLTYNALTQAMATRLAIMRNVIAGR